MLKIFFGNMDDVVFNTSIYFNNTYNQKWIVSNFGKKIIKEIDKSEVVSENLIDSPFLGPISPEKLSGGVKTLLLMKNDKTKIFNATTCGDNCAEFILEIAEKRDLTINLRYIMDFGDFNNPILILNTNKLVNNMDELILEAHEFV